MKKLEKENKSIAKKDYGNPPEREELVRKVEEYQSNIQDELNSLKKTIITSAIAIGTAYVSYRIVRYLTSPKKKEKNKIKQRSQTSANEKPFIVYEPEKKSNGLWSLLKRELAYALIDVMKAKIKDTFFGETQKKEDAE